MQNIHIKVADIVHNAVKKCYIIHAELSVTKEGLFREQFTIYKDKKTVKSNQITKISDQHLSIVIKAQVIGKDKGTPSLKEGVHKIGILETDDNSDLSDWKGFE